MTIAGREQLHITCLLDHDGDMTAMDTANRIERLQAWRHRPIRAKAIGAGIAAVDRRARQLQRRIGGFVEAWEQAIPESLHERTCVRGIRGGIAEVVVESSAVSYELDRRLREGLLETLRSNCGSTLVRVRLRVGMLKGGLSDD